jgi:hypothetical protein
MISPEKYVIYNYRLYITITLYNVLQDLSKGDVAVAM